MSDETDSKPGANTHPSFRGVYHGGLVRIFDAVPWDDGTCVEVSQAPGEVAQPSPVCLVIIAGFGLAGRWAAEILTRHHIDHVVIEKNLNTVRRQKLLGRKIIHGDVADGDMLHSAGLEHAEMLLLTVPDEQAVLEAIKCARARRPGIYIVARTNYTSSGMTAAQLGADAVIKAEQAVANRFYELLLHKLQLTY